MTDAEREAHAARRRRQLAVIDETTGKTLLTDQLYLTVLIDGNEGQGGWTLSTNASNTLLLKLFETIITEWTGRPDAEDRLEPTPDTVRKMRGQYSKLAAHASGLVLQQAREGLEGFARAATANDHLAAAALLQHAASAIMVLYRRSLIAYVEAHKTKGGKS